MGVAAARRARAGTGIHLILENLWSGFARVVPKKGKGANLHSRLAPNPFEV